MTLHMGIFHFSRGVFFFEELGGRLAKVVDLGFISNSGVLMGKGKCVKRGERRK